MISSKLTCYTPQTVRLKGSFPIFNSNFKTKFQAIIFTHAQLTAHFTETRGAPGFQDQQPRIYFTGGQCQFIGLLSSWHQYIDHFIDLQWPNHSNCLAQLIVSNVHFVSWNAIENWLKFNFFPNRNQLDWKLRLIYMKNLHSKWNSEIYVPVLILMSKFSRINAKSVVVKPTLRSSSIGIFIRISLL